eukprot:scaffold266433_cov35-Tisochrysis_lutea.AAC.3
MPIGAPSSVSAHLAWKHRSYPQATACVLLCSARSSKSEWKQRHAGSVKSVANSSITRTLCTQTRPGTPLHLATCVRARWQWR